MVVSLSLHATEAVITQKDRASTSPLIWKLYYTFLNTSQYITLPPLLTLMIGPAEWVIVVIKLGSFN